jgi:hypothetical protein
MHTARNRVCSIVAVTGTAVALTASPAFAGSDGCGDDEQCANTAPAHVLPGPSTPAQVPVAPAPATGSPSPVVPSASSPTRHARRHGLVRGRVIVRETAGVIPRGGVQAGAGGTAVPGTDGIALGLIGASLLLILSGGGVLAQGARGRRAAS